MRFGFVLSEWHRYAGWSSTRKVAEVTGSSVDELTARLRPWALEIISGERLDDGEYYANLVELDENGDFDTYLGLSVEDIFWFHEQEYVPAETPSGPHAAVGTL